MLMPYCFAVRRRHFCRWLPMPWCCWLFSFFADISCCFSPRLFSFICCHFASFFTLRLLSFRWCRFSAALSCFDAFSLIFSPPPSDYAFTIFIVTMLMPLIVFLILSFSLMPLCQLIFFFFTLLLFFFFFFHADMMISLMLIADFSPPLYWYFAAISSFFSYEILLSFISFFISFHVSIFAMLISLIFIIDYFISSFTPLFFIADAARMRLSFAVDISLFLSLFFFFSLPLSWPLFSPDFLAHFLACWYYAFRYAFAAFRLLPLSAATLRCHWYYAFSPAFDADISFYFLRYFRCHYAGFAMPLFTPDTPLRQAIIDAAADAFLSFAFDYCHAFRYMLLLPGYAFAVITPRIYFSHFRWCRHAFAAISDILIIIFAFDAFVVFFVSPYIFAAPSLRFDLPILFWWCRFRRHAIDAVIYYYALMPLSLFSSWLSSFRRCLIFATFIDAASSISRLICFRRHIFVTYMLPLCCRFRCHYVIFFFCACLIIARLIRVALTFFFCHRFSLII